MYRLPFTSAYSVEPNNESCRRSSKQLRKVAANVSLLWQCSPVTSNTSKSTTRNAGNSLRLENGAAGRITRTSPMGLARIMARTMLSAMHRGRPLRTLPALLVLAVSGTTAGADTAVMRPPPAGAERIMDAKQVMRLAAIVRSTGYACQEGDLRSLQASARGGRAAIRCYVLRQRRTRRPAHAPLHSANSRRCKPRGGVKTMILQEIKIRLRKNASSRR